MSLSSCKDLKKIVQDIVIGYVPSTSNIQAEVSQQIEKFLTATFSVILPIRYGDEVHRL
jgi:hypothetical protein